MGYLRHDIKAGYNRVVDEPFPRPEVTLLNGEKVVVGSKLQDAFEKGKFYYQFRGDKRPSRIMRCSSASELAWLMRQVCVLSPVVIRPMR